MCNLIYCLKETIYANHKDCTTKGSLMQELNRFKQYEYDYSGNQWWNANVGDLQTRCLAPIQIPGAAYEQTGNVRVTFVWGIMEMCSTIN